MKLIFFIIHPKIKKNIFENQPNAGSVSTFFIFFLQLATARVCLFCLGSGPFSKILTKRLPVYVLILRDMNLFLERFGSCEDLSCNFL